jgi:hypothetical protein
MNQANHRPPLAKRAMNALLWTTQVLWGAFFSITSFGKVLCYEPALWNQPLYEGPWFSAVPQDLFIFIDCEFLRVVGLIRPAMSGVNRSSRRLLASA